MGKPFVRRTKRPKVPEDLNALEAVIYDRLWDIPPGSVPKDNIARHIAEGIEASLGESERRAHYRGRYEALEDAADWIENRWKWTSLTRWQKFRTLAAREPITFSVHAVSDWLRARANQARREAQYTPGKPEGMSWSEYVEIGKALEGKG